MPGECQRLPIMVSVMPVECQRLPIMVSVMPGLAAVMTRAPDVSCVCDSVTWLSSVTMVMPGDSRAAGDCEDVTACSRLVSSPSSSTWCFAICWNIQTQSVYAVPLLNNSFQSSIKCELLTVIWGKKYYYCRSDVNLCIMNNEKLPLQDQDHKGIPTQCTFNCTQQWQLNMHLVFNFFSKIKRAEAIELNTVLVTFKSLYKSTIPWNNLFSWTRTFVVWRHKTCSWTLEFVDFKLYAILLKWIQCSYFDGILNMWTALPTKYTKLNVQQN